VNALAPLEIRALAKILDELDYYQLLHLERGAPASAIKQAFHQTSRAFHPDANRRIAPDLRDQIERISKRVTEAYTVLRDPRRRRAYDAKIAEGSAGVRMQIAEAKQKQQRAEARGTTPQGQQFLKKAQQEMDRGDWTSAARNLQTALTFEPGNAYLKELLAEAKQKAR
jgi:DnaJ-class molecular chaperone